MTRDDWLLFPRTAVAAAVAVVAATTALPALAQNTTSAVSGRVVGADGRPVAGATVTITHQPSGTTVTATTDGEGRYAARGLRAGGPYTITFQRGNDIDRRSDVNLALAETLTLDGLLGVPAQTVTVTGRAASARFDSANMGAGTQIGQRELQAFASIQRSLQDYARTDPRLSQTDKERGEISAGGQNTRYNSITIDGVTINDTFGLESNNLPTLKQPISIDAIQTVQVNLSNYDVTQKGYTGANVNAVTKSGTNEFTGSIFHVRRDDNLVGDRYNRSTGAYTPAPAFEETLNGFTIGGPIIKDKLFFFAAYEELASSRTSPDFSPIGGSLTNVGITSSAIQGARDVAASTYPGYVVGSPDVPTGTELTVKDTLLKIDWNISDAHRASVRYTQTEQSEPIFPGFGIRSLSLNSHFYAQGKEIETIVAQWFADWSPTFSTEFKYSTRDYTSAPNNNTRQPYVNLSFTGALPPGTTGVATGTRTLNIGTERFRHFNALATDTTDLYLGATWILDDHELKFGIDRQDNEIFNAFVADSLGNYTFRCEDGVYTGIGTVDCDTADAATIEAVVLRRFQEGTPSFYLVAAPLPGFSINDAAATWALKNTGLFLQDSWKVSNSLTLMAGVRMDQQDVPSRPARNAAVAAAPTVDPVTGRATGGFGLDNSYTIDGERLLQPRLGFNWKLGGNERRMQLRGGVGLFQGAAAAVWLSNPFSNPGNVVTTYTCRDAVGCSSIRFSPNPATQPIVGGAGAVNVDLLAPGLEQPSVWKMNLAFDAELPEAPVIGRTVIGAEWLHTRNAAALHYTHLNLGAPTRTGPDGRPMFYSDQAYDPACWTAGGARVSSCSFDTRSLRNRSFNDVVLASKTDKGRGDTFTVSLASADSRSAVNWSVAYTKARMTEVNPLTSSRAISNWNGRVSFDPNEDVASNSNYLIKDRFNASLSWSKAFFGNNRTTLGVFYEGRRGKPYSWTYINDLNGDGVGGNDLMYIPSAPGTGEVVFRGGAAEESRFWAVVNANPELAAAKGGVVGRNTSFNPWVNNVDVRLSQEVPGFSAKHKGSITLDILNFGNLLNKEWGRIDEIGFPSNRSFVNFVGIDPATGRYVYSLGSTEDFVTRQTAGESQWAVQLTLRYSF